MHRLNETKQIMILQRHHKFAKCKQISDLVFITFIRLHICFMSVVYPHYNDYAFPRKIHESNSTIRNYAIPSSVLAAGSQTLTPIVQQCRLENCALENLQKPARRSQHAPGVFPLSVIKL